MNARRLTLPYGPEETSRNRNLFGLRMIIMEGDYKEIMVIM